MLVVEDLIPDPYLVSQAEAEAAREIALSRIEIQGSLINEQASMTAINIIFRLPGLDLASEIPTIMADANPLLQRYRDTYPDLQFQITGSVPLGEQFAVASQDDGQRSNACYAACHAAHCWFFTANNIWCVFSFASSHFIGAHFPWGAWLESHTS